MTKWAKLAGLVAITAMFATPLLVDARENKGMSYVGWGRTELLTPRSDESIVDMRELGVDMVALNVFWFQDTRQSSVIYPDYYAYSTNLESLDHAIDQIHGEGMRVLLKPNLDIRYPEKSEWRGMIEPENVDGWFASYAKYILTMAELAEANGVEILSIGTELNGLEKYNDQWRQLISRVRNVYSGELIYAANHEPVGRVGGGYQEVKFWDELDYIGIDAYYRLSYKLNPDIADMVRAWQGIRENIVVWRTKNSYQQQVIFTEVGFRSINRAVANPWNYTKDGVLDLQEQADAYEALLIAFSDQGWWGGAMWWYWSTNPSEGGAYHQGFTPNGKPAGEILRSYYQEPESLREESEILNSDDSRRDWKLLAFIIVGAYLVGI